jgi:hypothetical protein
VDHVLQTEACLTWSMNSEVANRIVCTAANVELNQCHCKCGDGRYGQLLMSSGRGFLASRNL